MQNYSDRRFTLGEGPCVEGTIAIQISEAEFFTFFPKSVLYLAQSRDAGDHRAGAAGQRGEAGVRAESRVLETPRSQGEQEEREERAAHPRGPAAAHHPGQISSL